MKDHCSHYHRLVFIALHDYSISIDGPLVMVFFDKKTEIRTKKEMSMP